VSDRDELLKWAEILKSQGWGYYRAAFTHGRQLWDQALTAFEQAEAIFRQEDSPEGLVGALSGRASVLRSSGRPESIRKALELYREETRLLETMEDRQAELARSWVNQALAYRDLLTVAPTEARRAAEAIEACRRALEAAKRAAEPGVEALAACTVADLCLVMARLDDPSFKEKHLKEAMGFYGQAERLWEDNDPDGQALARLGLAEAYIALGQNLEGARDLLHEVLTYYEDYSKGPVSGPVRYQIAQVKELEAGLYEAEGDPERAARARQEALGHLKALGFAPGEEKAGDSDVH